MAFLAKANFAKGVLSAAIASTDTSLTLSAGHTIPKANTTDSYRAIIWDIGTYANPSDDPNYEFVDMIWSGTGDTYNITRAREGTAAASHPAGAAVRIHVSAGQLTELENAINALETISAADVSRNNIALNRFLIESMDSIVGKGMVDGIVDAYEDESGIDTVNSSGQVYDAANKLYMHDAHTKLLLHCDGTDGSILFPDSSASAHTVTAQGTAQVDIVQYKFGGASLLLGGSANDRLVIANHADWDFGSGDFTLEFWLRFNTISTGSKVFMTHNGGSGNAGWEFIIPSSSNLRFAYSVDGTNMVNKEASWTPSTGVWYHIACVRSGANIRFFVDGSQVGSTLNMGTDSIYASTAGLSIGDWVDGWMDEIRISKGIARWTSNFTPPSAPYTAPSGSMTLLSNVFTAQAQPDSARLVLFEEDIDPVTLNTNLKVYASRDGGTTYTQATLTNEGTYQPNRNILVGAADVSGQPAGTSMRYKIETLNNKLLKLHGTSLSWA